MSIEIVNPGLDWTYICNAALVVEPLAFDCGFGRCPCGWLTSTVATRHFAELMDTCDAHNTTSTERMMAHVCSVPPDPRAGTPEYDAETLALLDELRELADILDEANRHEGRT